jgi:hypothetical protein
MGGSGSGRWNDHQKALAVEDCLILDVATFHANWQVRQPATSGTIIWQAGQSQSSASYTLTLGTGEATLRLVYLCNSLRNETIRLLTTRPNYGGLRWWFLCPACDNRVRRVLLPPSGSCFRCRRCHRLTYRSCQESHTAFGEFRRLLRFCVARKSAKCPSSHLTGLRRALRTTFQLH